MLGNTDLGELFRGALKKTLTGAGLATLLVVGVWLAFFREEERLKDPPGVKTKTTAYTDPEGEFSADFPAPYFLETLPVSAGHPARHQGSFRTGTGVMLTAVPLPLPPESSLNYAEDAKAVFKGEVVSCVDSTDGPVVCTGAPEPVPGQEGVLVLRRLFFGKRTLLLLSASGKGIKAADPDLERLSATVRTSLPAAHGNEGAGGLRVSSRRGRIGVVFPGKPELRTAVNAGWRTEVYRYSSQDGSVYTATFMSRSGGPVSPKDLKRGWSAQLAGRTVTEQTCRGGVFSIDCSAEVLDDAGASVRLRYVGSSDGVAVLSGAACPQESCAKDVAKFMNSAYPQ